jgi:hypothetical protein
LADGIERESEINVACAYVVRRWRAMLGVAMTTDDGIVGADGVFLGDGGDDKAQWTPETPSRLTPGLAVARCLQKKKER